MTTQKIIEVLDRHSVTYMPLPIKELVALDIIKAYANEGIGNYTNSKKNNNDEDAIQEPKEISRKIACITLIFAGIAAVTGISCLAAITLNYMR